MKAQQNFTILVQHVLAPLAPKCQGQAAPANTACLGLELRKRGRCAQGWLTTGASQLGLATLKQSTALPVMRLPSPQDSSCAPNPCLDNSTCSSTLAAPYYTCSCTDSYVYTGSKCEARAQPCLARMKAHGVAGWVTAGGWLQRLKAGVRDCPVQADPCASIPCANGGMCSPTLSDPYYSCSCKDGYTGATCQARGQPCFAVANGGPAWLEDCDGWLAVWAPEAESGAPAPLHLFARRFRQSLPGKERGMSMLLLFTIPSRSVRCMPLQPLVHQPHPFNAWSFASQLRPAELCTGWVCLRAVPSHAAMERPLFFTCAPIPYEWPPQTTSIITLDESNVFPLQCKSADVYACSLSCNVTVSGATMALKPISNWPDCASGTATISE